MTVALTLDTTTATDQVAVRGSEPPVGSDRYRARAVIYLRVSTPKQADTDLDPEGLSLPAQREACQRRANDVGADIVDEYVDRGESAKTADRPRFLAMLRRIKHERDVDYVIVDKVNRFARNRRDDANVLFELRLAGAKLISVKENIDDSPAGALMHGMLASFAEYESRNNGVEALKGMTRKAQVGGTPGRAPLGYINVRQPATGNPRGIAVVEIHPETARHVRWAFQEYATGEWTLASLVDELDARGLRSLPSAKRPGVVITKARLATILGNPYYTGVVTFRGVQYVGRHEPLISRELFDQVQSILASRAHSGEKSRRHLHYLKGTLFCGHCASRMTFSRNTGRGGTYDYFKCTGPQRGLDCTLGLVRADRLEAQVEQLWTRIQLTDDEMVELRRSLIRKLATHDADSRAQLDAASRQRKQLDDQRSRLLRAHLEGAVPLDRLKPEQERIAREMAQADAIIDAIGTDLEAVRTTLDKALDLVGKAGLNYLNSDPEVRRHLNQSFFARISVLRDGCAGSLASPFRELLQIPTDGVALRSTEQAAEGFEDTADPACRWILDDPGLNMNDLVPPGGLEPPHMV